MKLLSFLRGDNSPRTGLALNPEQAGQQVHHLEERIQGLEQALADQQREVAEALRLGRRLQAQGDAHLWERIEELSEEVEALSAERALLEAQV